MKMYFAATAPGNEQGQKHGYLDSMPRRLLSYYLIKENQLECGDVFKNIKKHIEEEQKDE